MSNNNNDEQYKSKYLKYKSKYLLEKAAEQERIYTPKIKAQESILAAKQATYTQELENAQRLNTQGNCITSLNDPSIKAAIDSVAATKKTYEEEIRKINTTLEALKNEYTSKDFLSGAWEILFYDGGKLTAGSYDAALRTSETYDFALNLLKALFTKTVSSLPKYKVTFKSVGNSRRGLSLIKKAANVKMVDISVCSNERDVNLQQITKSNVPENIAQHVTPHYNYQIFKCIFFNILYGSHNNDNILIMSVNDLLNTYPCIVLFYDLINLIKNSPVSDDYTSFMDILNRLGFDNVKFQPSNKYNFIPLNDIVTSIESNRINGIMSPLEKKKAYKYIIAVISNILFKDLFELSYASWRSTNIIHEIDILYRFNKEITTEFAGRAVLGVKTVLDNSFTRYVNNNTINDKGSYRIVSQVTHSANKYVLNYNPNGVYVKSTTSNGCFPYLNTCCEDKSQKYAKYNNATGKFDCFNELALQQMQAYELYDGNTGKYMSSHGSA